MAGQSTLDFLGKNDFRRQRHIAQAQVLDDAEEAETDMLEAIHKAQQSDDDRVFNRVSSQLVQRAENLAYAMAMAEQGVVVDEATSSREADDRNRERLRKREELQEFRAERKSRPRSALSAATAAAVAGGVEQPRQRAALPGFLRVRGGGAGGAGGAGDQRQDEDGRPPAAVPPRDTAAPARPQSPPPVKRPRAEGSSEDGGSDGGHAGEGAGHEASCSGGAGGGLPGLGGYASEGSSSEQEEG